MKTIGTIFLLLFSSNALTGDGQGFVAQLFPTTNSSDGVAFVALGGSQAHNNQPKCSGSTWALSLSTSGGRAIYSTLLSAQAQKMSVVIYGNNLCDVWPDRESIAGINLIN